MKRLTVITVTFNAESCIEKTLRSVIEQSVYDEQIEYIVVDGFSKDNTLAIVNQYGDRLAHVISEADRGIYDAMNKGIRMATAPWICFMNAGDTFFDDKTVESLNLPEQADCVLYGDCMKLYEDRGEMVLSKAKPFFERTKVIGGVGICHQSVYQPTAKMKEHPFRWEKYPHCADFDFLWTMHKQGMTFSYINRPLCVYDYGQGFSSSLGVNRTIFEENAAIAHKKYSLAYWKGLLKFFLKR